MNPTATFGFILYFIVVPAIALMWIWLWLRSERRERERRERDEWLAARLPANLAPLHRLAEGLKQIGTTPDQRAAHPAGDYEGER